MHAVLHILAPTKTYMVNRRLVHFPQDGLAQSRALADERIMLAPMQTKKMLERGFAISDVVPFVKAGRLKARQGLGKCLSGVCIFEAALRVRSI